MKIPAIHRRPITVELPEAAIRQLSRLAQELELSQGETITLALQVLEQNLPSLSYKNIEAALRAYRPQRGRRPK